jgi:hypothetical protein
MNLKEREALQRYVDGEQFTHDVLRHLVRRLLEQHKDVQERLLEEERENKELYARLENKVDDLR